MNTPSPAQLRAIQTDHPQILVLASPGSGKTSTLVNRLASVIHEGADPRQIVVITFTNAAAREVESRLRERYIGPAIAYTGTLHGYMLRLLQEHGRNVGLPKSIGVMDEEQTGQLIEECIAEMNWKGSRTAVDATISTGPFVGNGNTPGTADLVAAHFWWQVRRTGMLSFDALLHYGLALIRHPDAPLPAIQHLLVDEYQDSASLDAQIYTALPARNRFMVADADQSIFGFRGADVGNCLRLAADPKTLLLLLEANYRSDVAICEAAQRLIEHNIGRVRKQTVSASGAPGEVTVTEHRDPHAELGWITSEVKARGPSTCAVLVRTNHLVKEIAAYLVGLGIPVAARETEDRPADWWKAKLYLTLLANPENDMVAGWWLKATTDAKMAGREILRATAAGLSINAHVLKIQPPALVDVPEALARVGISQESLRALALALGCLQAGSGLPDLLLSLAARENAYREAGDANGVHVGTIHGAKGREFDTVILPAFEDGIIPGTAKGKDIQEERRLCFVGATRARHTLLISYCQLRKTQWGRQPEPATPSRFIKEMLP